MIINHVQTVKRKMENKVANQYCIMNSLSTVDPLDTYRRLSLPKGRLRGYQGTFGRRGYRSAHAVFEFGIIRLPKLLRV